MPSRKDDTSYHTVAVSEQSLPLPPPKASSSSFRPRAEHPFTAYLWSSHSWAPLTIFVGLLVGMRWTSPRYIRTPLHADINLSHSQRHWPLLFLCLPRWKDGRRDDIPGVGDHHLPRAGACLLPRPWHLGHHSLYATGVALFTNRGDPSERHRHDALRDL